MEKKLKKSSKKNLETNKRYEQFLKDLPVYIKRSLDLYNEKEARKFRRKILKTKRIFFTGTGSSVPCALFGAQCCLKEGLPASFLPNGGILGMNFNKNDLIFLNSQGFNRGDAELVAKKAKNDGACLAVLTANRESSFLGLADFLFFFSPFPEKLFCRPAGVQTAIIALAKILDQELKKEEIKKAIKKASLAKRKVFDKDSRYIVLSSGVGMPVALNYSLALREGCGIDSQVYDIETYGHGMYVSDQTLKNKGEKINYILINLSVDNHTSASVERIKPFIKNSNCELLEIKSNFDIIYVYLEQLTYLGCCVLKTNKINEYDMNNPFGKEENRYYHKTESYNPGKVKMEKFIKKIKRSQSESNGKRLLIEISGGSCSGKSYFAREIKKNFSSASFIYQDDYQLGKNFKERKESFYKFDDLKNFQINKCFSDIKKLLAGKEINVPCFDLKENISKGERVVYPSDVIILEGIYASYPPLNSLSKFKIYIEVPYYLRFLRRIDRFVNKNQNSDLSVPLNHITSFVYKAHNDFVVEQKKYADLVVVGPEILPVFKRSFEAEFKGIKLKEVVFKKENIEISIGLRSSRLYLCLFRDKKCVYVSRINKKMSDFIKKVDWFEK